MSAAPSAAEPSGKRSEPEISIVVDAAHLLRRVDRDPRRRAGELGGGGPELLELRVEQVARAARVVAVAVAGDALEGDGRPGRVAVGLAARRDHGDLAGGGDPVDRQLPADQARERVHALGRLGDRGEVAEAGDARRRAVPALGLRADHGLVDAARAAFEDLPVLVDQELVADVVPALRVAVVAGDGEHDPGRLLGRVVVGGHRVVDERHLDLAVDRRLARRDAVAAPRAARDDGRGSAGLGAARQARRHARGRLCPHEAGAQLARGAAQAQLELVGGAGEGRVGAGRQPPAVGPVVADRVQRHPARPAAAALACAQLRLGVRAARPDEAHEVEAPRRAQHAGGAPAGGGGGRLRASQLHLEDVIVRGERGEGGAEADGGGGESAGFQSLPTGE